MYQIFWHWHILTLTHFTGDILQQGSCRIHAFSQGSRISTDFMQKNGDFEKNKFAAAWFTQTSCIFAEFTQKNGNFEKKNFLQHSSGRIHAFLQNSCRKWGSLRIFIFLLFQTLAFCYLKPKLWRIFFRNIIFVLRILILKVNIFF